MKKLIFPIVCCFISVTVSAQLIKPKAETQKKQSELDWFNCSFDQDSVYGAEVNKAYDYLKANKKKAKKRPVVALIGTGMDVEHEDLKHAIWINPKEKSNQKDDDKNGFVDDINGWNFIGGKDGQVMEALTREGEREFFRLKDKYADYIFDGKKYYKIVNGKRQEVPAPENIEEYNYYRYKVMPESRIGGAYGGLQLSYVIEEYVEKFDKDMKKRFPGKELTVEDFQSCYDPKAERDSLSEVAFMLTAYYFSIYNTDKWEPVYQNMGKKSVETAKASYEEALKRYGSDNRKEIVGDNPLDINDTHYGNNVLLTSDAATGVMKAGVIAAKRDNGIGSNGIADNAEIMTLRIHPGEGEPYLKDMALAIRYAVNHGADVIVLPEQNSIYPKEQKQWVSEALKEAEKKGALVIVPVWDLSMDMDKEEFFPNRKMNKEGELTNFMVVASSDKNGNPVLNTNYGATALDIYAPGTDIYSSYMGDTYQKGTGEAQQGARFQGGPTMKEARYFYVPQAGQRDELPSEEARHAVRVLRLVEGDEIFLIDGAGSFLRCTITLAASHHCAYRVEETQAQQPTWRGHIHLAIAPTKDMGRMEWMAEKATEVGWDEVSFLDTQFSERRSLRADRIDKIVVAAMKQSRKAWKPVVNEMTSFRAFVDAHQEGRRFICHCYPEIARQDFFDAITAQQGDAAGASDDITVLVGPEGDFSVEEVRYALDRGYESVSLGKSRLRTETAGLTAVVMAQLARRR